MENNIRRDLCQELSRLLEQWNSLGSMVAATQRDYTRIKTRIDEVVKALEDIAVAEGSR